LEENSLPKRLDRLLSQLGYASRSQVKKLIKNGAVTLKDGGILKFDSLVIHSQVLLEGEELDPPHGSVWLLNKPRGYVSSRAASEGKTVYQLLPERFTLRHPPLSCVGRLDKESRGLLLLSDDGDFIHRVTSPRSHLPKVYRVLLESEPIQDELSLLEKGGLFLPNDNSPLKPCKITKLSSLSYLIKIYEGRYHQVRLMFEMVNNFVKELERIKIGNLSDDQLKEGSYRLLSQEEILRALSEDA
jgi:16S rRNA pseudouridine516 synthase